MEEVEVADERKLPRQLRSIAVVSDMTRWLLSFLLISIGVMLGAVLDTPIANAIFPQPPSFVAHDRAERLDRFPQPGLVAFVGDSHVERGPWWMFDVANYGISGDDSNGVLARIDGIKADRTIVLIGVNDILAGRDPARVAEIIGKIVAKRPVTLLAVMPVRGRYNRYNAAIVALNSLLKEICTGQCIFIDTWSALQSNGELDTRFTNDGLHLNADGYEALATVANLPRR
jgi:hypothetical protein